MNFPGSQILTSDGVAAFRVKAAMAPGRVNASTISRDIILKFLNLFLKMTLAIQAKKNTIAVMSLCMLIMIPSDPFSDLHIGRMHSNTPFILLSPNQKIITSLYI